MTSFPLHLVALVVCDEFIKDRATSKSSYIGLFNFIAAAKVPTTHHSLYVIVTVTDGHGEAPLELRLLQDGRDTPLLSLGGTVRVPKPSDSVELVFNLRRLTFPDYGSYRFEIHSGPVYLGSKPFAVIPQGEEEPGQ